MDQNYGLAEKGSVDSLINPLNKMNVSKNNIGWRMMIPLVMGLTSGCAGGSWVRGAALLLQGG